MTTHSRAIKIDGQDYLLRFDIEALCAAEQETDVAFFAMVAQGLSAKVVRALFVAALGDQVERPAAIKLIDAAGFDQATAWVVAGLQSYLGVGEDAPKPKPRARKGVAPRGVAPVAAAG